MLLDKADLAFSREESPSAAPLAKASTLVHLKTYPSLWATELPHGASSFPILLAEVPRQKVPGS